MARIIVPLGASLFLLGLFFYHVRIETGFPALLHQQPTVAIDTQEKWSKDGYQRYTSSLFLKHENATRTLRG